jgi:SlyX protein
MVAVEDRVTELESRVAFQEQMIDELNAVVSKQDKILIDLSALVKVLNQKLNQSNENAHSIEASDTPPPHY